MTIHLNTFFHIASVFYIALYGTIQPSGPTPFIDKNVDIVIDAENTSEHTKPNKVMTIRFVYLSLCCSALSNINFDSPM